MEQLTTQLKELRLQGMSQCWQTLLESRKHHEISLAEGLELLLQAESEQRTNNRFERLRRNARFRYQAAVAEINFSAERRLDKQYILELATNAYIGKGESVLITGATGSGKSFIASALGHQACAGGYKVMYFNAQKLFIKTKMARLDGTIYKLFEQMAKTSLLIIDDFGLMHLEKQQQMDLMELIEDRHAKAATIIASQLPVANWYNIIGEETIADAILDRLVHTSHRIELQGEKSLRKKL
jgi:DNA replication protein DnaC